MYFYLNIAGETKVYNGNGRLRNQKLYRLSVTLIFFGLLSVTFYIVDHEFLIVFISMKAGSGNIVFQVLWHRFR